MKSSAAVPGIIRRIIFQSRDTRLSDIRPVTYTLFIYPAPVSLRGLNVNYLSKQRADQGHFVQLGREDIFPGAATQQGMYTFPWEKKQFRYSIHPESTVKTYETKVSDKNWLL
jgi:hypothetical protein